MKYSSPQVYQAFAFPALLSCKAHALAHAFEFGFRLTDLITIGLEKKRNETEGERRNAKTVLSD